jgi:hypothetical protein
MISALNEVLPANDRNNRDQPDIQVLRGGIDAFDVRFANSCGVPNGIRPKMPSCRWERSDGKYRRSLPDLEELRRGGAPVFRTLSDRHVSSRCSSVLAPRLRRVSAACQSANHAVAPAISKETFAMKV